MSKSWDELDDGQRKLVLQHLRGALGQVRAVAMQALRTFASQNGMAPTAMDGHIDAAAEAGEEAFAAAIERLGGA